MNAYKIAIEAIEAVNKSEINGREFEERIAPLRDVEPVVRCKDCRYSCLIPPCGQRKCNGAMEKIVEDYFYCADGERKDSEVK